MLGVIFFVFCRLGGWIESTSADIVLTGSVVSISWRQLWSEWNETAVYLSQGPLMCVSECVCFCVYWLECVYEMYINVQDVSVKVLFVFCMRALFRSKRVRRCLRYEASSPPRPPYGHLETLICAACVCMCVWAAALSVCVCVCVFSRAWAVRWWCKESLGGVQAEPSPVW